MLIQAAGHGLLRLSDTHPGAVVKPTTATEASMYVRLQTDKVLEPIRPFVPRLVRVSKLASPDVNHPSHTHEIEIENLCMLGQTWDCTADRNSEDDQPPTAIAKQPDADTEGDPACDTFPAVEQPSFAEDDASAAAVGGTMAVTSPSDAAPTTPARTAWSDPCVLDIKLGRIRHGPRTKPEKVQHILDKDRHTTGPSLALRICGLRHEHRQVDVNSLVRLRDETNDGVVSRLDSFTQDGPDAVDDERSALHDYAMMRSQRGGERSHPGSLLSGCATPLARDATPIPHADESRRRKRRMRAALGRRMEWIEGKSLGRAVDQEGFVESLAKYCTCVELRGVPTGDETSRRRDSGCEHEVPEQCESRSSSVAGHSEGQSPETRGDHADRSAAPNELAFRPQPHAPLVKAYRDAAAALRDAMAQSSVLEQYSFSSASVICVHDFHVDIAPTAAQPLPGGAPTAAAHPWSSCATVCFRSQLRLVDFSSSGALAEGNVFPDAQVGSLDGLANLVALFDEVLRRYCCTVVDS